MKKNETAQDIIDYILEEYNVESIHWPDILTKDQLKTN